MPKSAEYQCYKAIKARTKIIENIEQKRQASAPVVFFCPCKKAEEMIVFAERLFAKKLKKKQKQRLKKKQKNKKEQRRKRIAREREVHK